MDTPKCLACGGELEDGFVSDRMHGGGRRPADWIQGEPVRSFWTGVKLDGRAQLRISAPRCTRCGFIMLFAFND